MLNRKHLSDIVDSDLSNKEKIEKIVELLKGTSVAYLDGRLVYFDDINLMDYLHLSSSLIHTKSNHPPIDQLNQLIMEKSEHEMIVKRIVCSINSICLKEDKEVFIERYLYHNKISTILKKHCLSNNGYYQCLQRAIDDISDYYHLG